MIKPWLRQHLLRTISLFVCRGCVQNQFWRHFVLAGMIGTKSFTLLMTNAFHTLQSARVCLTTQTHKHIPQSAMVCKTGHTQTQKQTTAQTSTCHNVTHSRHHKVQCSVFYHKRKWRDSTLVQSENNITGDLTLVPYPHFLSSFVQTVKHFEQKTLICKVCSFVYKSPCGAFKRYSGKIQDLAMPVCYLGIDAVLILDLFYSNNVCDCSTKPQRVGQNF